MNKKGKHLNSFENSYLNLIHENLHSLQVFKNKKI